MPSYSVFGVRLKSDLELPELGDASQPTGMTWRVETHETAAPVRDWVETGRDAVFGTVEVRAYSSPETIRLRFDDSGTFDVHRFARTIAWYPGPSSSPAAVRADLLGRVMAIAAHADGRLALHASAVSIHGRAIAFLGPKHAGKSTLALALVRRGARLLTDDTLVVRFGDDGAPWVVPGVQRIRLWEDSARALDVRARGTEGAKPTVDGLDTDRLETGEVPLAACYVLRGAGEPWGEQASAGSAADPVQRAPMSAVQAALTYVRLSKLGALGGGAEGVVVLDRAARLARATTTYVAAVHRDLARLDDVAARVMAWHAPRVQDPLPNVTVMAR